MSVHPPAIAALGYVAASLTTLSFIPQAIKTLRTGDTRGISLRMYALFTAGIALWGIYGLLTGDGPLLLQGHEGRGDAAVGARTLVDQYGNLASGSSEPVRDDVPQLPRRR